MKKLKIGGATVNQIPFDWKNNTDNILAAITAAKEQHIKILCLPELCITGYGCEDVFLSEWLPEKAWEELLKIVPHCDNITVSVGLPVRLEGLTYNGACVIHNKKIQGITFKQNLANDGVHYEPRWFTAWTSGAIQQLERNDVNIPVGDIIYELEGIKFGFEICEDGWRKDKRPGCSLFKRGIDLILNPSASHFAMGKSLLREQEVVLEASLKFKCAYLFVNLLGNEAGRMVYDGDIIIAQHETLLAVNKRFSFQQFNLLACTVNFEDPSDSQHIPTTDNKEKNEELAQALSLALFDYLRKSKSLGYVLSLSGGADSSICAVLVAEMIRRSSAELSWSTFAERLGIPVGEVDTLKKAANRLLTCAYQGTTNSSAATLESAKNLADSIGAEFHHWNIDEEVLSYTKKVENALEIKLSWETDDIALQNIQARARSPIIWMLANVKRSILLTTSNRSEGDVGYATMDGDTSGSLAPVAGLSKVFILQWLQWAQHTLGYDGLNAVNSLTPTAELRPAERSQTDEKDLMPYPVLAEIEKQAILYRKPPAQVYLALKERYADHNLLKNYIHKFFKLWTINQWKRERIAPSFHVDDLNVDPRTWCRFPILSSGFTEELAELNALP